MAEQQEDLMAGLTYTQMQHSMRQQGMGASRAASANALADKLKKTEAVPHAAAPVEAVVDLTPNVVCTPEPASNVLVVVVGAGGNGARVVPPLMQMLRHGDRVVIIDHDIVEDRNLLRQHFTQRDVGSPKALVLADRYRRDGIGLGAYQCKLGVEGVLSHANLMGASERGVERGRNITGVVYLGCVDGALARVAIKKQMDAHYENAGCSMVWIDIGNDSRGGQVLVTSPNWMMRKIVGKGVNAKAGVAVRLKGLPEAMPQLLVQSEVEKQQENCADRLDIQTVQVNMLAASAAINCLSWFLLAMPFSAAGAFFSTANTMQPIKLLRWDGGSNVHPDTSFAA